MNIKHLALPLFAIAAVSVKWVESLLKSQRINQPLGFCVSKKGLLSSIKTCTFILDHYTC